ncbi:BofC C-terminal domain-containing protein [Brevibacillus borstelensis]|uniref:BofC C-terminal domain-containing protein n=1 Tax=Brevibacillus borstelensis TaxID=45462 RepID=UPI002E243F02|nr:BofC C-terminal domain-containing protein [Brevibacillus borstelensis]
MRRQWMIYTSWAAALAAGLAGGVLLDNMFGKQQELFLKSSESVGAMSNSYQVVLAKTYLCGVKKEEVSQIPRNELAQTLAAHNGSEIVAAEADKLILYKRENDIAPECKENGHFGISKDGMLTLFNGLPEEAEVVQTFYRINTEKMEARLSKEQVASLKKGIRVRDLAEYNSVLSTFGEFQIGAGNE